jgi:hypothetical protein
MLAEISDKMPTLLELWGMMLLASIPVLLGLFHRYQAVLGILVALPFTAWRIREAYEEAFLEPGFSLSIQNELGPIWITHSIASSALPLAVALAIFCWHQKKHSAMPLETCRLPR